MSLRTGMSLVPVAVACVGTPLLLVGGRVGQLGLVAVALYGATVLVAGLLAGARFRSVSVGLAAAPLLVANQCAYTLGFLEGVVDHRPA